MRKAARLGAELLSTTQHLVRRVKSAERRATEETHRRREMQDMLIEAENAGRKLEKLAKEQENANHRIRHEGRIAQEAERARSGLLQVEKERERETRLRAESELARFQTAARADRRAAARPPAWCKAEICSDSELDDQEGDSEPLAEPGSARAVESSSADNEVRDHSLGSSGSETNVKAGAPPLRS